MFVRLGRSRRQASSEEGAIQAPAARPADAGGTTETEPAEPLPEQPVPLPPVGLALADRPNVGSAEAGPIRARRGVLAPVRRSRSLLAAIPLPVPRIPRRAVFAVGICAGLAAPAVLREVAGRALMATLPSSGGRSWPTGDRWEAATMEIIRVTYASPRQGQAAATVGKLLEQFRK